METLIQHCKLLTVYGHIQYQFNGTKHCWSQANTKNMNLKSDNLDTTLMQHIAHQIKIGTFLLLVKLCLYLLNVVVLSRNTHSIDTTLCGHVASF
jgi:hypothetical protein